MSEMHCTWCEGVLKTGAAPVRHGMLQAFLSGPALVCNDLCKQALLKCCDELLDNARADFAALRAPAVARAVIRQGWWKSRWRERRSQGGSDGN